VKYKTNTILVTFLIFIIAGIFEIGGAYLIWLWLRSDFSWIVGAFGALLLLTYAIVQTYQPSYFHRNYIAYGGIFIILAMITGWIFEGIAPDIFDITGTLIALIGMGIVFYWPRNGEKSW
jgi:small multidrug resistance family-3 protein